MPIKKRLDKYTLMRESRMIKPEIKSYVLMQVNIPKIKLLFLEHR